MGTLLMKNKRRIPISLQAGFQHKTISLHYVYKNLFEPLDETKRLLEFLSEKLSYVSNMLHNFAIVLIHCSCVDIDVHAVNEFVK